MTDMQIEENVVIHNLGGRELKVDILRPAHVSGPVQGLLFLPEGGWQTANRAALKERYGMRLTGRMYQALEQAGMPVDLHLYAGQDHFFDQEAQFCDAIADAMAFFIARFVPVQQPVTTA